MIPWRNLAVAAVVVLLVRGTDAQIAPDTLWTRVYGSANSESFKDIKQTQDGGFILAGITQHGYGTGRIYMVKVDSLGQIQWEKQHDAGDSWTSSVVSVCQLADGGYAVAGEETYSYFLLRTNSSGDSLWRRLYNRMGNQDSRAFAMIPSPDGGFMLNGYANAGYATVMWLVKTNGSGDTLWTQSYGYPSGWGTALQATNDGGYILGGSFGNPRRMYLVKINASGDTLWSNVYGQDGDQVLDVCQTDDGGYILAGWNSYYYLGAFLVKTDATGNEMWRRAFYDVDSLYFEDASSISTTMGGFLIAGTVMVITDNAYLAKTDHSGNLVWIRTWSGIGSAYGKSHVAVTDGGYAIAGYTAVGSNLDAYLVRTGAETLLSTPQHLVIQVLGSDVQLAWQDDLSPYYRVFSDTSTDGLFETLQGSTSDTTFLLIGGTTPAQLYFRVVGSTVP